LDRISFMPLLYFTAALAGTVLVSLGPWAWVRGVFAEFGCERDDFPGTAGELLSHILRRANMDGVVVEEFDGEDHYDQPTRSIRLRPEILKGRSLTAIGIVAHQLGHAVQDRIGYRPFFCLAPEAVISHYAEKAGAILLVATPFLAVFTQRPVIGTILFVLGFACFSASVLVRLLTLPIEFDAALRRALPIISCGYLERSDISAVKKILCACALLRIAAALANIVNFWRWIEILRR